MRTILRLGVPALLTASAVFSPPAYASLEADAEHYSALPRDQIALNEHIDSATCAPAEAHYLPSFIRAPDGTIIGVGYIEMESGNGC
jgi:hypothetical protein